MNDPIADLLTRVRNAQAVFKSTVSIPSSKVKVGIAEVLKSEGYIADYRVEDVDGKPTLHLDLRYYQGRPVITYIQRASKPGLRQYRGKRELPKVRNGLGVAVVSTPSGIMSDDGAREIGHGGEILCYVA